MIKSYDTIRPSAVWKVISMKSMKTKRALLEGSTGLYTGSIFNDKSILRAGHAGEGRRWLSALINCHKSHI